MQTSSAVSLLGPRDSANAARRHQPQQCAAVRTLTWETVASAVMVGRQRAQRVRASRAGHAEILGAAAACSVHVGAARPARPRGRVGLLSRRAADRHAVALLVMRRGAGAANSVGRVCNWRQLWSADAARGIR